MTFLGQTFFSLSQVSTALKLDLCTLSLTHANICMRAAALGQPMPWESLLASICFALAFFLGYTAALRR
ncbi:Uncharacterised protein [uncultured archaeon]|nr:Uncharacterised protein [uncultured archaeon]